jgi:hypothetical protein
MLGFSSGPLLPLALPDDPAVQPARTEMAAAAAADVRPTFWSFIVTPRRDAAFNGVNIDGFLITNP